MFSILFNRPFNIDGGNAEGSTNLCLRHYTIDIELTRNHPESIQVSFVMNKQRHGAIKVGYFSILLLKSQVGINMSNASRENGQLYLRHEQKSKR